MKTLMRRVDERGVAAAEFALLLPVLLLMLLGIIEFGMIMYSREVVTNAAREGARAGIVQGPPKRTEGQIKEIARNYLTNTGINSSKVEFAVTNAELVSPNNLTVQATYEYNFLFPYIPMIAGIPSPLDIRTQVVMRHE